MHLFVGTSGFSYKEWKGRFYPPDLPAAEMLAWYSQRLPCVEINNTFYRLPSAETLAHWALEVPESFRFALKVPRRITHMARLKDCRELVESFCTAASVLGPRLGPLLFQLPPHLRCDLPRLRSFLEILPSGFEAAIEFRHDSWRVGEVLAALAERGVAFCVADDEASGEPEMRATARFGYLRLRRTEYDRDSLDAWAVAVSRQPWEKVYVFFKHEDAATGPALAARLREIWRQGAVQDAGSTGADQISS